MTGRSRHGALILKWGALGDLVIATPIIRRIQEHEGTAGAPKPAYATGCAGATVACGSAPDGSRANISR